MYPKWKETHIGRTHFPLNHECGRKSRSHHVELGWTVQIESIKEFGYIFEFEALKQFQINNMEFSDTFSSEWFWICTIGDVLNTVSNLFPTRVLTWTQIFLSQTFGPNKKSSANITLPFLPRLVVLRPTPKQQKAHGAKGRALGLKLPGLEAWNSLGETNIAGWKMDHLMMYGPYWKTGGYFLLPAMWGFYRRGKNPRILFTAVASRILMSKLLGDFGLGDGPVMVVCSQKGGWFFQEFSGEWIGMSWFWCFCFFLN